MAETLAVENLSIRLGEFALHGVSLYAERGDYVCLIGPTGAGKTILLECVAGLHHPAQGQVRINGRGVRDTPPEQRRVGYVPQDYALFPHLDVTENIAYGLVELGMAQKERLRKVQQIADLVQIRPLLNRHVSTLSGGEQQRVALARALVLDCHLLLLDEPLGALDWCTKREVSDYLRGLHRQLGLTVLHVTHDFTEALELATKVGVIHEGRLIQMGSPEDIFTRPRNRSVARFVGLPNLWPLQNGHRLSCPLLRRIRDEIRAENEDSAWFCLRPDQLSIGRDAAPDAAMTADGTVACVRWRGPSYELVVDVGLPLVVSMGARDFRALSCREGDRVTVTVEPESVHLLEGD